MDLAVMYLLSKKAGRPVKLVMDYEEEFAAGNPRHASVIHVKTGVKKEAPRSDLGSGKPYRSFWPPPLPQTVAERLH
jgi:Molybdopterin-binding domain of aldehyde dehydrogenase